MKWKAFLLVSIGLLLIVGSVYYLVTSSTLNREKIRVTEYSDVNMSDWINYSNDKLGFSVSLPRDYRIYEGDRYLFIYSEKLNENSVFSSDKLKIGISVYDEINLDLDTWISKFDINIKSQDSFTINDVKARKLLGSTTVMGTIFHQNSIYYRIGNKGIVFSALPIDSKLLDNFYSIVRSFRLN